MEGQKEGGLERERADGGEGGKERGWEGGREGRREDWREGGKDRGWERERGMEGQREGGQETCRVTTLLPPGAYQVFLLPLLQLQGGECSSKDPADIANKSPLALVAGAYRDQIIIKHRGPLTVWVQVYR